MVTKKNGFTLIELMIVVAIIAILAAIAYPSYQEYIRNTNRVEAQGEMLDIATRLQRYKIANFTFMKANNVAVQLTDIGVSNQIPSSGNALYTIALSNVTAGTWTLTATPNTNTIQFGNGHMVLNHRGERCWTKGSDAGGTKCVLSATTNWDGK